ITAQHEGGAKYYRPCRRLIRRPDGKVIGAVTLFQDVTPFKLLEELKSDFLAAVSHEFRTPLTSIAMSADILLQGMIGPLTDGQRELLESVKGDCDRLKKLVEEILALSKLESVRGLEVRDRVDIRRVIEESVATLRLQTQEKRITVDIRIEEGLPAVRGDFQQLCWAVVNLVGNAVRYTDPGGSVSVTVRRVGNMVEVAVADTGKGIPQDALERIFEKFVQLESADDYTPGSVGLGLTIARRVVENHGGRIHAESALGKGSVFRFTIPAMEG
ncbi:MAG: HAMP domain-containing sensor histidine kinase, partial [Bacteroidota bacterium]|nr:HAMP domain-containing sensor histidine kinase [Bacteroidota bacterium]